MCDMSFVVGEWCRELSLAISPELLAAFAFYPLAGVGCSGLYSRITPGPTVNTTSGKSQNAVRATRTVSRLVLGSLLGGGRGVPGESRRGKASPRPFLGFTRIARCLCVVRGGRRGPCFPLRPAQRVPFGASTVSPVMHPATARACLRTEPRQNGNAVAPVPEARPCRGCTFRAQQPPNPSLEPTRYGRRRKPGPRHTVHCRGPGLRLLPPRSAQLQR